jgi:hypothetical protein
MEESDALVPLPEEIQVRYALVEGTHLSGDMRKGSFTKLSPKGAEAILEQPVPNFSNLKIHLVGTDGKEIPGALYAKVVGAVSGSSTCFSVRFTSMSPEIGTFLRGQPGSGHLYAVS